jgi:hypothetical protein
VPINFNSNQLGSGPNGSVVFISNIIIALYIQWVRNVNVPSVQNIVWNIQADHHSHVLLSSLYSGKPY